MTLCSSEDKKLSSSGRKTGKIPITLPSQLAVPNHRFIKLGSRGEWLKRPIESGWNIFDLNELKEYIEKKAAQWDADEASGRHAKTKAKGKYVPKRPKFRERLNNYSYDDPEFQKWLKRGGNYGVTAAGGLIKIESDDIAKWDELGIIALLPETLAVQSSTPNRRHFYFYGPEISDCPLHDPVTGEDIGHIRGTGESGGRGGMVVGPGSLHPSGARYIVTKDLPIATITHEVLETVKSILTKSTAKRVYPDIYNIENNGEKKSKDESKRASGRYSDISDRIKIADIVMPEGIVSNNGIEIQGSHPVHGSTTGKNFSINIDKNAWYCFRHNSGGGPLEWLAVEKGIIDCQNSKKGCLKGKLSEVIKAANEKGFNIPEMQKLEGSNKFYPDIIIDDLTILMHQDKSGNGLRIFSPSKAANAIIDKVPLKVASWEAESANDKIILWTPKEHIWHRNGEHIVERICDEVAGDLSTKHHLSEVKRRINNILREDPIEFDTMNPLLVGTRNGFACNLATGEVRRIKPDDYVSGDLILPVDYDPKANCPEIFKFYDSICATDCDKMALIDDDVATLDLRQWQYILLELGIGGNGKGERQKFRRAFFGSHAIASIPLKDLNKDDFALSELFRKRACICGETSRNESNGEKFDTILLKRISGDDSITANRKFKNRISFVPFSKVTLDANDPPRFNDDSRGFKRRFRRVNMPYRFEEYPDLNDPTQRQKDPQIHEKLTTPQELSGYLNVLIERARSIVPKRVFPSCEHLTEGYEKQIYSVEEFIEEFCEVNLLKTFEKGWYIKVSELYNNFKEWATLATASVPGDNAFGRTFGRKTGIKSTSKRLNGEDRPAKVYIGIQFNQVHYEEVVEEMKKLLETKLLPNVTNRNLSENDSNKDNCNQCNQLSKVYKELKEKFGNGLQQARPNLEESQASKNSYIGYIGNIGEIAIESEVGNGYNLGNIMVTSQSSNECFRSSSISSIESGEPQDLDFRFKDDTLERFKQQVSEYSTKKSADITDNGKSPSI